MRVIGYETKKLHTTEIVKAALRPYDGKLLPIEDFLDNGLPAADLVIISGILRGSGLVYKECVRQKKDFLFIDHAYFLKGYEGVNWMRTTRNRHAFGPKLINKPSDRFKQFFQHKYALDPWKGNKRGHVLILPPTNAISWLFDAHDWEKTIVDKLKQVTDRPIKIRAKPEDPIVDDRGNLIRMQINDTKDIPLAEDIAQAHAVVAYNSNSVIEAVKQGVPVICEEPCAAHPISFKIDDLSRPDKFMSEPPRQQLFNDLAYSQFTRAELKTINLSSA